MSVTTFDDDVGVGRGILGLFFTFIVLAVIIAFLLMAYQAGSAERTSYMTAVQYIKSQCDPGDFFASASNPKTGEFFEFCKIDDSTIGVLISKDGRIIKGFTYTTKRYTQKNLLSFIRNKGLELLQYVDGIIPKE